jgi:TrmH family RNA methyltransferase
VDSANYLENLRVVLVAARNPLNIGAAARAMSNFGARHLRVVSPYAPAFREARSAVGASAVLAAAEECSNIQAAIADCSLVVGTAALGHRRIHQPFYSLQQGAVRIRKKLRSECVALLFGSEKWGLSNESLSHCHWLLNIPTRREHESMNLAQAVAVCLYELSRGATRPAPTVLSETSSSASMETLDRLTSALLECLRISGYIQTRSAATAEEKLRRLLRRFHLRADDSGVLLGMLHKILWKLHSGL